MLNIALVGPICSGKTTIAQAFVIGGPITAVAEIIRKYGRALDGKA